MGIPWGFYEDVAVTPVTPVTPVAHVVAVAVAVAAVAVAPVAVAPVALCVHKESEGNSLGNLKGIYQELVKDSMGLCRNFYRDFIMNSTEVLEGS